MNAVEAIGLAGQVLAKNNVDSEENTVVRLFFLLGAAFPLNENWMEKLTKDQATYFKVSLLTVRDPSMAAQAAADYAQYEADSSQMSAETNYQSQHLESEKSELRVLANGMSSVYSLEMPMEQLLRANKNAIISLLMG